MLRLRRLYHTGLAQASYLAGCPATGEALVVDPNRDIAAYVEAAEEEGLRITAVTETHIHADFVSGARELAARTGARLYLSGAGPAEWQYTFAGEAHATLLHDGDHFCVGQLRFEVLHTPGHTPEHLAFLVTDTAETNRPTGIFTGDFIFVGDVGRPDLLERAAGMANTMEAGARQLFHSLQRFRALPDDVQVWAGHGAGSSCGRSIGSAPESTAGNEKLANWAFSMADEDAFVQAVLEGQPDPPPYWAHMKRINKEGPPPRPRDLPQRLERERLGRELGAGTLIIDSRPDTDFDAGHIPGTINIPAGRTFLTWAGWLVPFDRPVALIADEGSLATLLADLWLIGMDDVAGYWTPEVITEWRTSGRTLATIERRTAREAAAEIERNGVVVLDVRDAAEYAGGHIPGSYNIPLGRLPGRTGELLPQRRAIVTCQSGSRAPIGASILTAQGWTSVITLVDGFDGWQTAALPVER